MLHLAHKNLDVYRISLLFIKEVYMLTKSFPKEEQYVLTPQIRRAAISVCNNIAEGSARLSAIEKRRFYEIARSSLVEVDTQFEISILLNLKSSIELKDLENYMVSISRMLTKMIANLK